MEITQMVTALVRLGVLTRTSGTLSYHEDQADFLQFGFSPELKTVSELDELYTLHKQEIESSRSAPSDRSIKIDSLAEKLKTSLSLSDDEAILLRSALQ